MGIQIRTFSVRTLMAIATVALIFMAGSACLGAEVTPEMKRFIEKNQSLGLKKYPVSFWSYTNLAQHGKYMTEAEVKSWADAGFTVPQSPSFDFNNKAEMKHIGRILKWADKYGMKIVLSDPRGYARVTKLPDGYEQGIRDSLKSFKKYPAVFGLHVGDEPDASVKEAFFEAYRIQKQVAPNWHPFANLYPHLLGIEPRAGTDTWENYLDEYAKKCNADIVGYDCYAHMNPGKTGWEDYYRNLRLHREASLRNAVPFWNTVLSVGHFNYRCPNQDELRWQFYTSVASGANGIVWFFYYMRLPRINYRMAPVDEFFRKTEGYYNLQRIQQGFHQRYGDLFNHLVSTRVTMYKNTFGGIELFTPNNLIKDINGGGSEASLVVGEFTDLKGRDYVMLVNNSMTDNLNASVVFHKGSKLYSLGWDGKEYQGNAYCTTGSTTYGDGNPAHILMMAPGQEAFYRIEGAPAK